MHTKTRGVIYLNQGTKCITRMIVSIFSLRKHYKGDVTVMLVGPQPLWFLETLGKLDCKCQTLKDDGSRPLVRKASLWRNTPYDLTMFIDADTLIVSRIDDYFDKIEEHKFCTGEFAGWRTQGRTMMGRIRSFAPVAPTYIQPAIDYGKATNTGIFGFTKDAAILPEWESLTRKGAPHNRIPDELACQLLLPRYSHWLAPVKWGVSVRMSSPDHYDDMRIVHYHGRKHAGDWELCALWKQVFWEFCAAYPGLVKHLTGDLGDNKLQRYLRSVKEHDVTIVSAVNQKYFEKLLRNYPLWMKTEGLMEYPMLLFAHPDCINDPRLSLLRKNVRIVTWDMEKYDSTRELMLSAFVLGTAKHVGTEWWIKVDADTAPKPVVDYRFGYKLVFPRKSWQNHAFSGQKCGYTKTGEFLVRMENWANQHPGLKGTSPVFNSKNYPEMTRQRRFGHHRIASFIALQSTEFTRKCAALAGTRLPVPSHDSYLWYIAARTGVPVIRMNLKAGFNPRS